MKKYKKSFIVILILAVLSATGCNSGLLSFTKSKEPEKISNISANSIIIDSEIRPQTIRQINSAKKAIFIMLSSLTDQEILNLLVAKSNAGVEIKILLDQWQRENSDTVKFLKNQNISVQYYPAQKGQYQRVRYMVVDYKSAIFYGHNWTDEGFNSHTLAIKLSGDTTLTIAKSFSRDWESTTILSLEIPNELSYIEDNITFAVSSGVKSQILKYINSANTEILAEVDQLSDTDTVEAILAAKNRGCDIRLILSPSCKVATPNTIKEFEQAQIAIRYYNGPDKKTNGINVGVFDNKTLVMTNSSWTYYSFVINHESSLTIPSPAVVKKINDVFEYDWKNYTTT